MHDLKRKDESPISDGINNNTYELLFSDFYDLPEEECQPREFNKAIDTIELFTKIHHKKVIYKLLKIYYKNTRNIDLSKITYNKEEKRYEYKDNDVFVKFNLFSNIIKNKKLQRILHSDKRDNQCHQSAKDIAPSIDNSKIVTGYITLGKNRYLHSVIEINGGEEGPIVLDWTMNLIIRKKKYVELTNFVELSSFDGIKVVEDIELISGNMKLGLKTYVAFRDEIINEMKSKPELFQPTDEGKRITAPFRKAKENKKK